MHVGNSKTPTNHSWRVPCGSFLLYISWTKWNPLRSYLLCYYQGAGPTYHRGGDSLALDTAQYNKNGSHFLVTYCATSQCIPLSCDILRYKPMLLPQLLFLNTVVSCVMTLYRLVSACRGRRCCPLQWGWYAPN
jgi:hypothetical protein